MTDPRPLTGDEATRIWRWQRQMFMFYGIAMVLLALAGGLVLFFGDLAWVRRAALAAVLILVVAATFVQFRERCPRCGLRLGSQSRLFLPEQCRRCSVVFARPPSG
ncbi:MAG TPA: hypothetical protein VHI72_00195 [Hyphomicrobiaceae bacterium]|jgi:hypothetical protein|nr:hypothetical protein [Hyphomicrobiaceae bacterium]